MLSVCKLKLKYDQKYRELINWFKLQTKLSVCDAVICSTLTEEIVYQVTGLKIRRKKE